MQKVKKLNTSLAVFLIFVIAIIFCIYKFVAAKFLPSRADSTTIQFTVSKNLTLKALTEDLYYYGFIKDKNAFLFALKYSRDKKSGGENAITIGKNTIDREAKYLISQNMTAWQLAEILLNQGEFSSCDHGCPETAFTPELMPGGDLAPTIEQKYEWVKSYEDCVKAIGRDGGQLSSEQYAQKTGIRKCVSPDGREFTQGSDGWTKAVGG